MYRYAISTTISECDSDSEPSVGSIKLSNTSQQMSLPQQVPATSSSATQRWSVMNAAKRDKQTDSDIFALGEAASRLDDIDDVLAGFEADFSELFNADGGSITTTTCRILPVERDGGKPGVGRGETLAVTSPGEANDPDNTVQVCSLIT
jgi:hypothetical protein